MKYKIKNHIIDAKSPVEALKIHKLLDSKFKDSYIEVEIGQVDREDEPTNVARRFGLTVQKIRNVGHDGAIYRFIGPRQKLEKLQDYGYYTYETIKDSAKDAEPTYRSVWLKVKEYVRNHYNFKYSRDFSGLMNFLNSQYGGTLDEDEVYKILRDLNSKGYVMFITDSIKDSLTREERELVDYCIDNIDHRDDANRLIELMRVYYSAYSDLARRKPNEIKEYFREVIGDSCKDSQEELDYLTEEEERAVDDYRQAIENTSNPKLLKLYQHILEEELEHIEELTSAEITEDSHTSEELLAVSKELMKNKMVITQSESIAKEYAKNKNPYHKYKVSKVSNGYKIEVVDGCKTKDMRLPDYKEVATYLHSLSKQVTQMSRSEEFTKQDAIKFVNDVEREANSIINKAKQEINTLTWIK